MLQRSELRQGIQEMCSVGDPVTMGCGYQFRKCNVFTATERICVGPRLTIAEYLAPHMNSYFGYFSALAAHPLRHFLKLSTIICTKIQPSNCVLRLANGAGAAKLCLNSVTLLWVQWWGRPTLLLA